MQKHLIFNYIVLITIAILYWCNSSDWTSPTACRTVCVGGGNFLPCPIGSDGPDALDTKWADFDVEKVNELLE